MFIVNTTGNEYCVLDFGVKEKDQYDLDMSSDDLLKEIESNEDRKYVFTWSKTPSDRIINEYLANFLMEPNTSASPTALQLLSNESLERINKSRPSTSKGAGFIQEQFANILGGVVNSFDVDKAAYLISLIKKTNDGQELEDVKVLPKRAIEITVNGDKRIGHLDYYGNSENSIRLSFDVKLVFDDDNNDVDFKEYKNMFIDVTNIYQRNKNEVSVMPIARKYFEKIKPQYFSDVAAAEKFISKIYDYTSKWCISVQASQTDEVGVAPIDMIRVNRNLLSKSVPEQSIIVTAYDDDSICLYDIDDDREFLFDMCDLNDFNHRNIVLIPVYYLNKYTCNNYFDKYRDETL